jgi:phasin family protein
MLTAEQILAAHKANVETLFGLTNKAFEGVEKLVELNVTASKAALTEAADTTQAVLSVKDAQELLALQASLFQPLAEKTAAYSRHLYDIASGTGAEFTKAFEAQTADAQKKFLSVVDNAAKNAPGRFRNRCGRDEERRCRRQQRPGIRAKGRQASHRCGRSQLQRRGQHRRERRQDHRQEALSLLKRGF